MLFKSLEHHGSGILLDRIFSSKMQILQKSLNFCLFRQLGVKAGSPPYFHGSVFQRDIATDGKICRTGVEL